MAKYTVNHSCGHTEEHNIVGTNVHGERDRKIEWLQSQVCSECYKAQKATERAEAAAAAAKQNANMPKLEGSEKQIAWAEQIRAKVLTPAIMTATPKADAPAEVVEALESIKNETSASWWIDHKDFGLNTLLRMTVNK